MDISNIKTDNKKLKNLFADSEDEEDVLKKGKQLTDLYKKEVQPAEPKKVSKLFADDEDSILSNNPLATEKKIETNTNKPDIWREESKGLDTSQLSSARPSVTKVSGRISVSFSQLMCHLLNFANIIGTPKQTES